MSVRSHEFLADLPKSSVQALVVDPRPVTRIGLGVLLHRQAWVERCLLASDRDEAVALAERHRLDVAIVDVSDAGPFIASYLAPLRAARPSMSIVLSNYCGPIDAEQVATGPTRLLTPDLTVEEVMHAVQSALLGEEVPLPAYRRSTAQLSEREREVLALLRTGATNHEIATAMNIGTETVKKHAGALYRKLGVRNRTEAAQRAAATLAA
jgi:two-component system response regulator DesR